MHLQMLDSTLDHTHQLLSRELERLTLQLSPHTTTMKFALASLAALFGLAATAPTSTLDARERIQISERIAISRPDTTPLMNIQCWDS